MVDALDPTVLPLRNAKQHEQDKSASTITCPVCLSAHNIRKVNGMIICTHCLWAMEVKRAS